jgi:hypothetical protein
VPNELEHLKYTPAPIRARKNRGLRQNSNHAGSRSRQEAKPIPEIEKCGSH